MRGRISVVDSIQDYGAVIFVVCTSQVLKQRSFRDFVVDARTGMPIDMTDDQKWAYRRTKAIDLVIRKEHTHWISYYAMLVRLCVHC
jgi:hypothetical protein